MKFPFPKKMKSAFGYEDDFYRDEEGAGMDDYESDEGAKKSPAANTVRVVKPREYADAPAIANQMMDGYTIVMDIEALDRTATLRLIDFLLGVIHVLGGDLRRVTNTTLVLSPRKGEIESDEDVEPEGKSIKF